MATTRPYLRQLTILATADRSASDRAQVPFAGAQIDLYRQGATFIGPSTTIAAGGNATVNVESVGGVVGTDTVMVGVAGATLSVTGTDTSATPQTVALHNASGASVALYPGDRLIPTNARPQVYADAVGATALGSTVNSDSYGRVGGFISGSPFDYTITPGAASVGITSEAALTASASSLTWTHPAVGPDSAIVVGISWQENTATETLSSVTYGGTAMTHLGSTNMVDLFYLLHPPLGPQSIVATWSGSNAKGAVAAAASLVGLDPASPFGTLFSNQGTGTSPSVTVSPSHVHGVILSVVGVSSVASTTTVTTVQTLLWSDTAGTAGALTRTQGAGSATASTGLSPLVSWTLGTSKSWGVLAVEGKPATARLVIDAEGASVLHSPYGLIVTDYATFQAAHDALPDSGGTIFVPGGTYSSTTVPAFTGIVATKPIAIIGESGGPAFARSYILHDMSNAENIDAIFLNVGGKCVLKDLFIQGPGVPGSGRGVRWYKAGTAPMAGLTLDNVTVWRSANLAFEFACDGTLDNYVSLLEMLGCTAYESASGGSLFVGGAGTNNNVFERCIFNGPGFGGFVNVSSCTVSPPGRTVTAASFPHVAARDYVFGMGIAYGTTVQSVSGTTLTLSADSVSPIDSGSTTLSFYRASFYTVGGCTYTTTSPTVSATSVSTIQVGDQVAGPDIVPGTIVTAVNTGANTFTLSQNPSQDHSSPSVTLTLSSAPDANHQSRGHVHLMRTSISRFSHCSFEGPGTTPAITTDLVSNDLELRDCYREKLTVTHSTYSFVISNMANMLIDGMYHLFHMDDTLFLKTGPGGMSMGRIANAQLISLQAPLTGTQVIDLSNATDDVLIDNSYEQDGNGQLREIVVIGPGAVRRFAESRRSDMVGLGTALSERVLVLSPKPGIYRITALLMVTAIKTLVDVTLTVKWRDDLGAESQNMFTAHMDDLGPTSGEMIVRAVTGSPSTDITFLTTKTAIGGAYDLYMRAELL